MRRDGRRMTVSVISALLIHAAVFVVFQFVVQVRPEMPEYGGPLTVTLADSLEPPQEAQAGPDQDRREPAAVRQQEDKTAAEEDLRIAETRTAEEPPSDRRPAAGPEQAPAGGAGRDEGATEQIPYTETRPREIDEPTTYHAPVRRPRDRGEILEGRDFTPAWREELEEEGAAGAGASGESTAGAGSPGMDDAGTGDPGVAAVEGSREGSLDLGRIDRALEQTEGTTGRPESSREDDQAAERDQAADRVARDAASPGAPDIAWEDESRGRKPRSPVEDPTIPKWVQREGLYLTVTVSFTVTPLGYTTTLEVDKSSGYPDVDAAVLDKVRNLSFNPVQGASPVRGSIRYIINTR